MHLTDDRMRDLAPLLGRTLVLVAHADDETVGCGALLQHVHSPLVVFATNGAPRDAYFWQRYGSAESYSRRRQQEARAALALAGVREARFLGCSETGLGIVDQELYLALPRIYPAILDLAEEHRAEAILALAYEGGHPDHDSCSFLASRAGSEAGIPVWEMPLYHRRGGELQMLSFHDGDAGIVLDPSERELAVKQRMVSAYESQNEVLEGFPLRNERFRPQPSYDYSRPSHEGQLNYEAWQWAMRGAEVCAAFAAFGHEKRARRQTA